MIEVILREDIKTLGRAGEMVKVKPGYAFQRASANNRSHDVISIRAAAVHHDIGLRGV